jgi:hypothetical protein
MKILNSNVQKAVGKINAVHQKMPRKPERVPFDLFTLGTILSSCPRVKKIVFPQDHLARIVGRL